MHLSPGNVDCCPFLGSGPVVVCLLFNVLLIVCGDSVVLVCITLCLF